MPKKIATSDIIRNALSRTREAFERLSQHGTSVRKGMSGSLAARVADAHEVDLGARAKLWGTSLRGLSDRFERAVYENGGRGPAWEQRFLDRGIRVKQSTLIVPEDPTDITARILESDPPFTWVELLEANRWLYGHHVFDPIPPGASDLPIRTGLRPDIDDVLNHSPTARRLVNDLFAADWRIKESQSGIYTNPQTQTIVTSPFSPPNRAFESAYLLEELFHAHLYRQDAYLRALGDPRNPWQEAVRPLMMMNAVDEGNVGPWMEIVRKEIVEAGGPQIYRLEPRDPIAGNTFDLLQQFNKGELSAYEAAAQIGARRQFEMASEDRIYHVSSWRRAIDAAQQWCGVD